MGSIVIALTGEQIRAARAMLRIDQAALAREAGVSLETIKRLEAMRGPVEANTRTVAAIAGAFQNCGIAFDLKVGEGPGVQLLSRPEAPFQMSPDAG